MSNHQEAIDLARDLTGNQNLYTLQPFIKITGDTALGLFLERIVYWSDRSGNERLRQLKIFYKSADEWEDEIGFSYAQVTLARKKLETMGYIQTSKHKVGGAPTIHYYANMDAIKEVITKYYQDRASDYANLEKSEIQETPISESEELQIEGSPETIEIQESPDSSYNSSNSNNNSNQEDSPNGEGDKSPSQELKSPLMPETPGEVLLFERINRNRAAKNLRCIKLFQSLEQKESCNYQYTRLGEEKYQRCIDYWLTQGITALGKLILKLETWEIKKGTAPKGYDKPANKPIIFQQSPDPIPPPALSPEQVIWQQVLADSPQIPKWLAAEITPIPRANGTFKLAVSNDNAKQWIDNRLMKVIKPTLNRIDDSIKEIEVIIQ